MPVQQKLAVIAMFGIVVLLAVVAMSLDSLWSAPVSDAAVPAPQLYSGVTNVVREVEARRFSSSSETIVPDSDSRIGSAVRSSLSASEPAAKPPHHTAVHGSVCPLSFVFRVGTCEASRFDSISNRTSDSGFDS